MNQKIVVGLGSCGIAAGSENVYAAITQEIQKNNLPVKLEKTGCIGMCYREVLVEIDTPEQGRIIYGDITPDKVPVLLNKHIIHNQPIKEWIVRAELSPATEDKFFEKQKRIVLRNCGNIDPESITEYLKTGGYQALKKVVSSYTPTQVIEIIKSSGLRGRGGAGFTTGMKWELCRKSSPQMTDDSQENSSTLQPFNSLTKYVICNADEGDPGAFMDRAVLESDPHSVIEGLIIAGYAIGAVKGYIYVRAEYPLAIRRLELALKQALKHKFLGQNILGTEFAFDIEIKQGAGAFVCGEETALIASIEGQRGMPKLRPPFPTTSGLWGMPTSINNVETLANVPWILVNGAEEYAAFGTGKSKGTKVFALAGRINNGGLVEVPMGLTLREIIFDIGGGIKDNKRFKAVQLGGPSGGCLPESLLDTAVDYESLTQTGAIMGSGGMVVMDETSCMVDIARFFISFTQSESCGKCTFCRIGTRRMLEILNRITEGKSPENELNELETLAKKVKVSSLCGLGQTAPNPVLTTLRYFRDEYESHIKHKKCPAKKCRALIKYSILPDKCTGCTACFRVCPVQAITGERKKVHLIDDTKCIRCNACFEVCKFAAVLIGDKI